MSIAIGSLTDRGIRWPLDRLTRWLLIGTLCMGLSILYQIYFYEFSGGVLIGGERQRLLLKVAFTGALMFCARRFLNVSVLLLNFPLKVPLLFLAFTILAVAPFLDSYYAQALNLLFFMPLLIVDWRRPGGEILFRAIWKIVVVVVVVQLLLDPLCKLYFSVSWGNAALVGGMGNPNVFGIFLIASGLACVILFPQGPKLLASVLFLITALTGSLAATLIGIACVLMQVFVAMLKSPSRMLMVVAGIVLLLVLSATAAELLLDSTAIRHAFDKFQALLNLLGGSGGESLSVTLRVDYTRMGMQLLGDSPWAVLTGHPRGMPMYSGDGMWVAMVVTYGLPLTLAFIAVNTVAVLRAFRSRARDLRFSGCLVLVVLAFFVTNRILDYWPAALIYLLAFSYLTTRGVRHTDAEQLRMAK